jgi:hypothetical protein
MTPITHFRPQLCEPPKHTALYMAELNLERDRVRRLRRRLWWASLLAAMGWGLGLAFVIAFWMR